MNIARSLGLGRAFYHLWYQPAGALKRWRRQGFWRTWKAAQSRREMRATAQTLSPPPYTHSTLPTPVAFLTGNRYWEQTAYCLHSLQTHLGSVVRTLVIDDGSLQTYQAQALQRISPGLRVINEQESAARLSECLPPNEFPTLHQLWRCYKHIRKLIDPHLLGEEAVLVLDSDMVFKAPPEELREWLGSPRRPIVMQDCIESYGYTKEQLRAVCRKEVPDLVNVGVTGLRSGAIDWALWEHWCRELVAQYGRSYYLEQALVAMHLAFETHIILPPDRYAVFPDERSRDLRDPSLVLGHYVAESKLHYFLEAWRP